MKSATLPGESGGSLEARYDAAGNMTKMALQREGECLGGATAGDCSQQFVYDWDEVGRLVRARRWDNNLDSVDAFDPTAGTPAADLRHTYDASDQRVLKEAVDAQGEQSFTLYVFATMELRRAQYGTGFAETQAESDYEVSHYTVVPYLMANGVRLARLVYHGSDEVPEEDASTDGSYGDVNASVSNLHVFFELGDHLGSTSVVLDKATGELVERSTFQGYGGAESDYRPGRWKSFREDYRFTGKEDDVEVGLQYFGFRFLNPLLGRWISGDPLEVHSVGASRELNVYAYVSGTVLKSTDPLGLCDGCEGQSGAGAGDGSQTDAGTDPGANVQESGSQQQAAAQAEKERADVEAEKSRDAWAAGMDAGGDAEAEHKGADDAAAKMEAARAKSLAECGEACKGREDQFNEGFQSGANFSRSIREQTEKYFQTVAQIAFLGRGTPRNSLGSGSAKPPPRAKTKPAATPKAKGTGNARVRDAAADGRRAHNEYPKALGDQYDYEVRLPSGKRADAVHKTKPEVRELKPDTSTGRRKGSSQVEGYRRELEANDPSGRKWTSEVDTYQPKKPR